MLHRTPTFLQLENTNCAHLRHMCGSCLHGIGRPRLRFGRFLLTHAFLGLFSFQFDGGTVVQWRAPCVDRSGRFGILIAFVTFLFIPSSRLRVRIEVDPGPTHPRAPVVFASLVFALVPWDRVCFHVCAEEVTKAERTAPCAEPCRAPETR